MFTIHLFLTCLVRHSYAFCPERCSCKLVPSPTIDCSKANLDRLPSGLSNYKGETLEEVNLSNNKNLKSLPQGAFEGLNISVLKLSSTGITSIKPGVFSGVVNINTLYLDRNKMTYTEDENPLSGLEQSLEYLQLQSQNLQEIPHFIRQVHSLIEVDLSDNNIQELHDASLTMIKAKRLILQRNNMHTISKSALVSTKPKDFIDLSFNQITDVSFLWDYCKVDKVDLTGNPIHCHCELVVYRKAMPHPQVTGTCASPPRLANVGIMSEDFISLASRECRVGSVTSITCPGPQYRVNLYTQTIGESGLVQNVLYTSGADSHHTVLLNVLTVFIVLVLHVL